MFDPQTTLLIQRAPQLPNVDLARLPEDLTSAFTAIVTFRLRERILPGAESDLPLELRNKLDEFRRMAAVFESMVALSPDRENRQSAAFVAGQAYHLLHSVQIRTSSALPPLRADAISPEVSALLLFLIANQPSDAIEMARFANERRSADGSASSLLVGALNFLSLGKLEEIRVMPSILAPRRSEDSWLSASEALYSMLFEGVRDLASFLVEGENAQELRANAFAVFRRVQMLSIQEIAIPMGRRQIRAVSTLAGPHHLASLLLTSGEYLTQAALGSYPPPEGIPPSEWKAVTKKMIEGRPFLWRNHLDALQRGFLSPGISAVLSFPTGAGKTTLSELKVASALATGGSVIYLAPTHALVAQIKRDLTQTFPGIKVRESVVVEDFYAEIGENFASADRQIVVMTPERCLALLSMREAEFSAIKLAVFDECHLLHPKNAGHNRRSLDAMLALLHLREAAPDADWMLLSAMVANGDELASWLEEITGRRCLALSLNWKPTRQARGCLVFEKNEIDALQRLLQEGARGALGEHHELPNPPSSLKARLTARPFGFFGLQQTWQTTDVENYSLQPLLNENVLLSASRNNARTAWRLAANKNVVSIKLAAQCLRIGMKVLLFVQNPRDIPSIVRGINADVNGQCPPATLNVHENALRQIAIDECGSISALLTPIECAGSHHALMLPVERELAETLFRRNGGIKALVATATLAQGVNLPADVVLIVGDERFDTEEDDFAPLEAHELLNAAGRAGRAGHVAQGVVIVLPQYIVSFDAATSTIGNKWAHLQASIFSKADQCLVVQDPIKHFLDRLQIESSETPPDLNYFLRRLPPSNEDDEAATKRFFHTSFGYWQAQRHHQEQIFDDLMERAMEHQDAVNRADSAETWQNDLSYRTGIQLELIQALDDAIKDLGEIETDTESLVRWFSSWLNSDPRWINALFGHRLPRRFREQLNEVDMFGGAFADAVWGWMSGETLIQLSTRLGQNAAGSCDLARKFVLRLIPEIAFAAGLMTRIRRMQIESTGEGEMPLVMATIAMCIRDGAPEPEIIALRILKSGSTLSRKQVFAMWSAAEEFVTERDSFESFSLTMRRVRRALGRAAESEQ